jgi:hypothetical protein
MNFRRAYQLGFSVVIEDSVDEIEVYQATTPSDATEDATSIGSLSLSNELT